MFSPAECASAAYIHRWTMYVEHVLITGSKFSPLAACPHLQNFASSAYIHRWTMYSEHVLITGSKCSTLAANPQLQNVHPQLIFTAVTCIIIMFLSPAASNQLWQ
jgi:hypothetical protein